MQPFFSFQTLLNVFSSNSCSSGLLLEELIMQDIHAYTLLKSVAFNFIYAGGGGN